MDKNPRVAQEQCSVLVGACALWSGLLVEGGGGLKCRASVHQTNSASFREISNDGPMFLCTASVCRLANIESSPLSNTSCQLK